jgi:hypothetical protein
MKRISLTKGKEALVDDQDYKYLMQWIWYYSAGYARRTVTRAGRRISIFMHNVVAARACIVGSPEIDHRNLDGLDNQRRNLRPATRVQQVQHRGLRKDNRARFIGVTERARLRKWEARISVGGRYEYLGLHPTDRDAARAYNRAAIEHFGEFAVLNSV